MTLEEYVKNYGRLPDEVENDVLRPFLFWNEPLPPPDVKCVTGNARLTYSYQWAFFWRKPYWPKMWSWPSRRTVVFQHGTLNVPGQADLSDPWWMAALCHEWKHLQQFARAPWKWPLIVTGNVLMTVTSLGYFHNRIPIEVEASAWGKRCYQFFTVRRRSLEKYQNREGF